MDREQLTKILENHKHWLAKDCEGLETMRENLYKVYVYPYKEGKPKLPNRLMQMKGILIEFTKLWARHKELRFGQVIAIIQMECESDDLFYVNDNTILYKLKTRNEEERNSK